jgi:hypothetical protein
LPQDNQEKNKLLLHKHVFQQLVLPNILMPRAEWDNLSEDPATDGDIPGSFDECEKRCTDDASCLQYAFHSDGRCLTSNIVKRGVSDSKVISGWMMDRIQPIVEKLSSSCSKPDWVFP